MEQKIPELSLKYKSGTIKRCTIKSQTDVVDTLRLMFDADTLEYREEVFVLYFNIAMQTIGYMKISSGGIRGSVIDIRMVLSTALLAGATGMILAHNHPSGSVEPSTTDINLTKKLKEAGKVMDIELHDHIIMTKDSHNSIEDYM